MKTDIKNTVIHIGMPKAASTSLQKNFLAHLPMINFTGGFENYDSVSNMSFIKAVHVDDMYFDADEIRNGITQEFDDKLPIVLSKEFSCSPFLPLSRGIPQSRTTVAKRFKILFPDAKILIIIRNQFKLQKSLYGEFYKHESKFLKTRSVTFKKWINLNIELEKNGKTNVLTFADFYSWINIYNDLFKDVKVVVFEEMIKDMHGFIENELCPFIGVYADEAMPYYIEKIENSRHSKSEVFADNLISKIIYQLQKNLGNPQKSISIDKRKSFMKKIHNVTNSFTFGKIDPEFTKEQEQFINSYYAKGNRKVSEILGIDLEKYGYPV